MPAPRASARLLKLLFLLFLLIVILGGLLALQKEFPGLFNGNKQATGSALPQKQASRSAQMRVVDVTWQLPAEENNPLRTNAQTLATQKEAQETAQLIAQKLKENPALADAQIATLSSIPISIYRLATDSAVSLGGITVTSPARGVERVTQSQTGGQ